MYGASAVSHSKILLAALFGLIGAYESKNSLFDGGNQPGVQRRSIRRWCEDVSSHRNGDRGDR